MRTQRQLRDDEEREFNDSFQNGILKPGITHLKIPLRMADSAGDLPQARDSDGRALRQPGFTARDATARDARQRAYESYETRLRDAWRNGTDEKQCPSCGETNALDANYCSDCGAEFPADDDEADRIVTQTGTQNYGTDAEPLANITGIGSHSQGGQREGAACTINGQAGHLRPVDGKLVCIPDRQSRHSPDTTGEVRPELYDPAKGAIRPHGKGYNKDAKDQMMDSLYAERDRELREAWRRAK